jgi:hypothetical protein
MSIAELPTTDRAEVLQLDPEAFAAHFHHTPFLVSHGAGPDHPLFRLPRIIELARTFPEEFVEYNAGKLPVSIDSRLTPRNGLSIEETIRRIEEHCSWMVLKRVEQDSDYRNFLDTCLDEVQHLAKAIDPGMSDRAGAVFVSSPGAVTPYHLDAEYNFLLQIRGTKTIHVFDPNDPEILSELKKEEHGGVGVVHRNLVFKDEYQKKAMTFELTPGTAIHVPPLAPHWVQNGPAVSISFSAGFLTERSDRHACIREVNRRLRRLGLPPSPPGVSPWRDRVKCQTFRAWRKVARLFGR